jgi:hypothetical protein
LEFSLLAFSLLCGVASAQETTAGLQGTVKDSSGGVLVKGTVEATSPALIGVKRVETDQAGYYRFANLPPGKYTVTVTATGFRTYKQENIDLSVGRLPSLDIVMQVGAVTETVDVSAQAAIVDVTQSKVQTNISDTVLQSLPTQTRSFQSVIQFAPGARSEPLQSDGNLNGYQIDGASNSENSYLVEGMETASVGTGNSAANVPMDFIQEVQVKSSGFEAEFGGALGGVVNVIQKRGSNEWHGTLFTYFNGSAFNAAPNPTQLRNPEWAANANGAKKLDQPLEYYYPKKDQQHIITPGFTAGGYLLKNRLWVFAATAPEFQTLLRQVNFAPSSGVTGLRDFHRNINTYYSNARVDLLATQKIRLFGSWAFSQVRGTGTTLPQADDVHNQYNSSSTTNPDNFNGGFGYVQPNVIYSTGADITLNANLILTSRYGYFYTDNQDRGKPAGVRYYYRDTNYSYNTGTAPALAGTKALDGTALPTAYVNPSGWFNIGDNNTVVYDKWKRYSFAQDLAYFKSALGTHNLKFGYGLNHATNDVFTAYNTAQVYVGFNVQYGPQTSNGIARCKQIIAQNTTLYGQSGGAPDGSACQGLWGTVNLRDLATTGKVGGWNHFFYAQDSWTISRRLTMNVGLRLDKESLPSYDQTTGFEGISFGWGSKIAPRLGASYDLLGNGKIKAFGSFGYFYDIMKYNLPRGSFGGDYWHDCVYALDTPDYTKIIPSRDANGHYCPLGGGSVGAVGSLPAGMRFIENFDYREPANDPNQTGSLGKTGLVDPNLNPMKQHEMAMGIDWAVSPALAFEARYSRKRLDRTIEDAGTITQDGEVYYITNPGESINQKVPGCSGCPTNPKPIRNYDGIEFRLTKRMSHNWFGSFSYTYSRLYGNYSGLTSTDVSDGIGRNGANADRAFDEPFMQFDAHGHEINGPLGTDRPHTIKAQGFYNLKWWKFDTLFGLYQQAYSGTPLSSYISVWGAPVFVEGRGKWVDVTRDATTGNWIQGAVSDKRGPRFFQTDLSASQEFHPGGANERLKIRIGAEAYNLFNQHSVTIINQNLIRTSGLNPYQCGTAGVTCSGMADENAGFAYASLMTKGYDYVTQANTQGRTLSSLYGQPTNWQNKRSMRFQLVFTF